MPESISTKGRDKYLLLPLKKISIMLYADHTHSGHQEADI
jgi:hypothetical protein